MRILWIAWWMMELITVNTSKECLSDSLKCQKYVDPFYSSRAHFLFYSAVMGLFIISLLFHWKPNHQAPLLHRCAVLYVGKHCKILKLKLVGLSWQPSLATLAPWAIFHFPRMKLKLKGCRFKEIVNRICCWSFIVLWKGEFQAWFQRCLNPWAWCIMQQLNLYSSRVCILYMWVMARVTAMEKEGKKKWQHCK
jgi:hypothetical protein